MKLEYNFSKCILDLDNPADSWEHIIPESIGGQLEIKALCTKCNSDFGSELISKVKCDPSIRMAVRNLRNEIPELFETIESGQEYFSRDTNKNIVKLKYKNSKLETIPHKKEDGSIILDTKKGVTNIEQMLEKEGLTEEEIITKKQFFEKLPDNKMFQLSDTLKVVKWSIDEPFPSLEGPLLDEKVIALTAYEFLSLLLGDLIYDDKLNFVREFIRKGEKSEKLFIEHLQSGKYSSFHRIYPDLLETEIVINIALFRWLVYKVHFKGFKLNSLDFVYLEDLKHKETLIAKTVEEAKQGIYIKL